MLRGLVRCHTGSSGCRCGGATPRPTSIGMSPAAAQALAEAPGRIHVRITSRSSCPICLGPCAPGPAGCRSWRCTRCRTPSLRSNRARPRKSSKDPEGLRGLCRCFQVSLRKCRTKYIAGMPGLSLIGSLPWRAAVVGMSALKVAAHCSSAHICGLSPRPWRVIRRCIFKIMRRM